MQLSIYVSECIDFFMPVGNLETLGSFALHFGLKYEIIYQHKYSIASSW